jgi:hypothetical protein
LRRYLTTVSGTGGPSQPTRQRRPYLETMSDDLDP